MIIGSSKMALSNCRYNIVCVLFKRLCLLLCILCKFCNMHVIKTRNFYNFISMRNREKLDYHKINVADDLEMSLLS